MKAPTLFLCCLATVLALCGCDVKKSDGSANPPQLKIDTTSLPHAIQATYFEYTITASGGSRTGYTWSVISGTEPAGCALVTGMPSARYLGIATTPGTYTFTVMVEDNEANQATQQFTLVIDPPPHLSITTTSLNDGTVAQSYHETLQATGGAKPYRWSLAGGQPGCGLTMTAYSPDASIDGFPRYATTLTLDVKVVDATNQTDQITLTLTIRPGPLDVPTTTLDYAVEGYPYSFQVDGRGGTGELVSWSVVNGSLPAGLAIQSGYPNPHCFIVGTPTASGSYPFTLEVADSAGTHAQKSLSLDVMSATGAPAIANQTFGPYSVNDPVDVELQAAGGTGTYNWAFTGGSQIPTGLSISNATGTWKLTGAPSQTGSYSVTLAVTDSAFATATRSFTIEVVRFPSCFGIPIRKKTVFLIDASGSMYGSNIATARAELTATLNSMTYDCEFDICAFGSQFPGPDYTWTMWSVLLPAIAGNVSGAISWVNGSATDPGGGTPIYPCLKKCCDDYPVDVESVFLITAGYPNTGGSAGNVLADFPSWFMKFDDCQLNTIDLSGYSGGAGGTFLKLLAYQGNGSYVAP